MASSSKSLKEYLKRYEVNNEEDKKKKKKNKKQKTKAEPMGVLVVDEDPVWQKPVNVEEDNGDNSSDEDKPVVDEDIEIKRMKRLQQLRARCPFNSISEDGSGWVTVGDSPPKQSNSDLSPPRRERSLVPNREPMSLENRREGADLSPPRQRWKRHNTPSPEPETNHKYMPPPPGSDLSPPRKRRQDVDTDLSPPMKSRKDSNEDLSPPRKGRKYADADLSPPRKSRNNVDADLSLPRNSRSDVDTDLSPPRKSRKDVDGDLSPPRNKKQVTPHPRKEQAKVGLISGREISDEINKTKKDEWLSALICPILHLQPKIRLCLSPSTPPIEQYCIHRLGLGDVAPHPSKFVHSNDPLERKLRYKLDAARRNAAKIAEESTLTAKDDDNDDDEEDCRTSAFAKK